MKYDVFLVSSLADRDTAEMLVRRLRALKFKVRYDKTREHTSPRPKDLKDVGDTRSIVVLWSKSSCNAAVNDGAWIYDLAHRAGSRKGALVQLCLDNSVPGEPFTSDEKIDISGLAPRKIVNGYYDFIDIISARNGRKGLRDWLKLKARDTAGKAIWKNQHPADPLSKVKPKGYVSPAPDISNDQHGKPLVLTPPVAPVKVISRPILRPLTDHIETIMLAGIGAGIALMFLAAYLVRAEPEVIGVANSRPSYIFECPNGEKVMCPIGTLEPGPIEDDT